MSSRDSSGFLRIFFRVFSTDLSGFLDIFQEPAQLFADVFEGFSKIIKNLTSVTLSKLNVSSASIKVSSTLSIVLCSLLTILKIVRCYQGGS